MQDSNLDELLSRLTSDIGNPQFVQRKAKTAASSNLFYSASHEFFRKEKERNPFKNAWEFLILHIWGDLLDDYSGESGINISAPTPLVADDCGVTMEYLTAPNAIHLNRLKKGVRSGAPFEHMRVDASLTYHAGALCKIKEQEKLLHKDFQVRHVLYSYTLPALYVIDVENSRVGCDGTVKKENAQFESRLRQHVQGRLGKDESGKPYLFDELFEEGKSSIKPMQLMPDVIKNVEDKYGLAIDVNTCRIALR